MAFNPEKLRDRLMEVVRRIEQACGRSAHGQPVTLVAACKKQSVEAICGYIALASEIGATGHSGFSAAQSIVLGENYVQEWAAKRELVTGPYVVHLLGPLQSNKVSKAVKLFDCIESIHSTKLLELVAKEAAKCGKVQEVFLQVNISSDLSKSGFSSAELLAAYETAQSYPTIGMRGLMTITREYQQPEQARSDFRKMRELRDSLDPALVLSMGMSQDFEVAIEEGASLVRIGSAIFGERE